MALRIGAREQPVGRSAYLPIGPQEIEQLIGQHHIAVLAPFALPHVDDHTGVIDVVDGKRDQLGNAQARGVDNRECGSVLDVVSRLQKPADLIPRQNCRQRIGPPRQGNMVVSVLYAHGRLVEEPQRTHDLVESLGSEPSINETELILAHMFKRQLVR